jgi:hypothetical protein
LGEICGVTVDANGAVYIGDYNNGVQKYVPTSNPPTNADFVETFTSVSNPAAVAAGKGPSAGSLFVNSYGERTISKISSSTGALEYVVSEAPASGPSLPTVDRTTGHVYFSQGATLYEFDASGTAPTRVSTIDAGSGIEGVGISGSGQIYLSRADKALVSVYGPLAPPTPFIESQSAASVFSTEATLEAQIDPEGSATEYRVEYGLTNTYETSTPTKSVGSDETSHTVRVRIVGLSPGSDYHFRFVATNSVGTTFGVDRTFRTFTAGSESQSCANQAFRIGAGTQLPDCRAYEMVSPVEKNGIDIDPSLDLQLSYNRLEQASTSGDTLTFATSQGIGEPEGVPYAPQYLSSRTTNGWQTRSLALRQGTVVRDAGARVKREYEVFTPDLCNAVLLNFSETPVGPNAAVRYPNLYKNDVCGNGGVVGLTPEYPGQPKPEFSRFPIVGGISRDGRCVVYFSPRPEFLVEEGVKKEGITEVCDGVKRQVNILPDGKASTFAVVGAAVGAAEPLNDSILSRAVSEDGSTIYWSNSDTYSSGPLYVRINARAEQSDLGPANECLEPEKACTLSVSSTTGIANTAYFDAASVDGSRVFFHFEEGSAAGGLYEYDLTARSSRLIATGVSPVSGTGVVGGVVMGASDDGSKLYFASKSVLWGKGTAGAQNLYLYDADAGPEGEIRFIADLSEVHTTFPPNFYPPFFLPVSVPSTQVSRVTPDGQHAVFATRAQVTDYDNRDVGSCSDDSRATNTPRV